MEEKRCCENCGRLSCANSMVAYLWNLCVEDGFTKYWMPKEKAEGQERKQTEAASGYR